MVRLYFMRASGDFVVDLVSVDRAYKIDVKDTTADDPYQATATVATYQDLVLYLDTLFQQVMNDLDCTAPFLHFQYNICPFPTVLMPIQSLNPIRYARFMNALHYHFQVGNGMRLRAQESTAPPAPETEANSA